VKSEKRKVKSESRKSKSRGGFRVSRFKILMGRMLRKIDQWGNGETVDLMLNIWGAKEL
jgi:hypothetical protein